MIASNVSIRSCAIGICLPAFDDSVVPWLHRVEQHVSAKLESFRHAVESVRSEACEIESVRLCVKPLPVWSGCGDAGLVVGVAELLDRLAESYGIEYVGGMGACVAESTISSGKRWIDRVFDAVMATSRVCGFVNVASTRAGARMELIRHVAERIVDCGDRGSHSGMERLSRFAVSCNVPQNSPYMPLGHLGSDAPEDCLIMAMGPIEELNEVMGSAEANGSDLSDLFWLIQSTIERCSQVAETMGIEVARLCGVAYGGVDVSVSPYGGNPLGSVQRLFSRIGVERFGVPGSIGVLWLLNEAVRRGALRGASKVTGLGGTFLSVCEDYDISSGDETGELGIDRLLALSSVCSVGLDMLAVPAGVTVDQVAAILVDEVAIGIAVRKATAVRLFPCCESGYSFKGNHVLGKTRIIPVPLGDSHSFICRGGPLPGLRTSIDIWG